MGAKIDISNFVDQALPNTVQMNFFGLYIGKMGNKSIDFQIVTFAIATKTIIITCLMFVLVGMNAQTVNQNNMSLKYTDILASSGDSLLATNQIINYLDYDFSGILRPRRIFGIIGDNYISISMSHNNVYIT